MVRECGGHVLQDFAVLDVYRRHRALKPAGIARLNEAGERLAAVLADEIACVADKRPDEGGEEERHA
jgi:hypothetical protein